MLLFVAAARAIAFPGGAPGEPGRVYLCPMHADVRAASPGRCPRCGMALVESAGAAFAPLEIVAGTDPTPPPVATPLSLTLEVRDEAGRAVTEFALVHERPLHLFLVHQDLGDLLHLHPDLGADGRFHVRLTLPRAGRWQIYADFVPRLGMPQLAQGALLTAGYRAPLAAAHLPDAEELSFAAPSGAPGARIILEPADRVAGVPGEIVARAGGQIRPWMGAPAHLLAVSEDLAVAVHAHAERRGDRLAFALTLPRPGRYRVWLQLDRGAGVETARFTVRARSREAPFLPPR